VSGLVRAVGGGTAPGARSGPGWLRPLPEFRDFTSAELRQLLAATTRWDLPEGRLLFREGDVGSTCFIVVRGLVDVSIKVRGQPQLLGQLPPGSIFGQVSLLDGEPRTTSCSIRRDAVLAELERQACERLLGGRAAVARKFLTVLNRGLIAALRRADRQLMQLNGAGSGAWRGTFGATWRDAGTAP
jgi:CRP-like cAMP-binding protein